MISVIVPVYRVEKFLRQCLDSALNQTYRDLEIIVVDDGSPDQSPQICDEYAERDPRVVVIHQQNGGLSAARNSGLKIAKGEFVGFVDSDDWIAPDMYETMLNELQASDADMAVCGYDYCHENGLVDEKKKFRIQETEILSQKEFMRKTSDIPPSIRHTVFNKLFRRDLLDGIRFYEDLRYNEDVQFLTEYMLKIRSAAFVRRPLYFNRIREGSATHGGASVVNLSSTFQAHDFMYENIVKIYPELKDCCQRFLLDVSLLEYNMAKRKYLSMPNDDVKKSTVPELIKMKKHLKRHAWKAVFNRDIYWKTRLAYLLVR